MTQSLWDLSTFVIPLFLAIILHEIAHGLAAYKLGDSTAKSLGRLTLNPIPHIDPIGSILVPAALFLSNAGVMFGWAKPVPVNFDALRDRKKDMGLVALAGPLLNFLLALLTGALIVFLSKTLTGKPGIAGQWFLQSLMAFFSVNLALCAFNLLPILPLDGGRILVSVLPKRLSEEYAATERYGFFVLMGLLFLLPIFGIDFIRSYMAWMVTGLMEIITFIL